MPPSSSPLPHTADVFDLSPGHVDPIIIENATVRSIFRNKDVGLRAVVGVTCGLSIVGSLLIIISYLFQRRRTKAREILVHISVMDLGVSLSNLIGLSVYFDQYYPANGGMPEPHYMDGLCKMQAFFAAYCTLGSIYWTTALAAYLYFELLYHREPKYSLYFARVCYGLCYGLALGVTLWLILRHKLGYSPYDSSGWCSLIAKDPVTKSNDLLAAVFGHDLWMILSIVLIIVFYVSTRSFVSHQVRKILKVALFNSLYIVMVHAYDCVIK